MPMSASGSGLAVVDALAELHLVDPDAVGLGDLGRPDGFVAAPALRVAQAVGAGRAAGCTSR